MLAAAGGARNSSQLPFLISKTSNFFQATSKPLNPKLSTKNSKACSLKRTGKCQFETLRGRTNKNTGQESTEQEEQPASSTIKPNIGRIGSLTKQKKIKMQ